MEDTARAVREKSPHARTERREDAYGEKQDYLVEFPGLTLDELRDLSDSKAINYIEGRAIPYTAIVDPFTMKQLAGARGVVRTKQLTALIQTELKGLRARHGPGIDRKLWDAVLKSQTQIDLLLGKGKLHAALGVYRDLASQTRGRPEVLRRKAALSLECILDEAAKRLDKMEERIKQGEGRKLAADLRRLGRALAGTALEKRARALYSLLKSS